MFSCRKPQLGLIAIAALASPALLEGELQPVLKALRKANINVVAIRHHMVGESPRMLFLHYCGVGPAAHLAQGIRLALDAVKSVPVKREKP